MHPTQEISAQKPIARNVGGGFDSIGEAQPRGPLGIQDREAPGQPRHQVQGEGEAEGARLARDAGAWLNTFYPQ